MYLTIRNSEDGLVIGEYADDQALLDMIREETSDDLVPEARAVFVEVPPTPYAPTNHIYVFKGDVVRPWPVEVVTEWRV